MFNFLKKQPYKKSIKTRDIVRNIIAWNQRQLWSFDRNYTLPLVLGVLEIDNRIYSICITDVFGIVIDETLINPNVELNEFAYENIGFTKDELDNAPLWAEYSPRIMSIINGRKLIIYDAMSVLKLLYKNESSEDFVEMSKRPFSTGPNQKYFYTLLAHRTDKDKKVFCAANLYRDFLSLPDDSTADKKPNLLEATAVECGVSPIYFGKSAIANCVLTLRILERISAG